MFNNETIVIKSLYGLDITPDPEQVKIREEKIKSVLQTMGNKYLLAKPVERKDGRT